MLIDKTAGAVHTHTHTSSIEDKQEKNNKNIKEKIIIGLFLGLIFIFLCIFFIKMYTIVIFDTDDWTNASLHRRGIPLWKAWNPIKILPETSMQIATNLASIFIMPFNNDFISATTIMYGIIISAFIVMYVYFFIKVIKAKYEMSAYNNIIIAILFLLSHFLIFRSAPSNNVYMFYSVNTTSYFHYIIPALLNCTLVMYIISNKKEEESLAKKSIIVLAIYLAIFSNIFHSIILAVYIGSILLINLIKAMKNKTNIKQFIKDNYDKILILILWGISQIFEINGGRANGVNTSFMANLKIAISNIGTVIKMLNKQFIAFSAIVIITAVIMLIRDKRLKNELCIKIIISGVLTFIYLVLAAARSYPTYITRPDTIFGIVFYVLLIVFLGLGYIIKKIPKSIIVCPVLIFVLFTFVGTLGKTYKYSNISNITPESCIAVDNYIIEQIVNADKANKKEIELKVPKFGTRDNWPIATYSTGIIDTLYDNGIIKNKIKVNYILDENVNKEFIKNN